MQGNQKTFTVSGVTVKLARPSLAEMTDLEPTLRAILGDLKTSEFSGGIEATLQQAVADESDADKAAFKKLADVGARLELWDQWVKFAECENFLYGREQNKLKNILNIKEQEFKAAGLSDEQTKELLAAIMQPESFTNDI